MKSIDGDGKIRLSQANGNSRISNLFDNIEDRIKDHEQAKLKNPEKGNNQGWACTDTASWLATETQMSGTSGFDAFLGQTGTVGAIGGMRVNARSVDEDDLEVGDTARYFDGSSRKSATHFATIAMFNKSGEPVVFSKSGEGGPNEFGTAAGIGQKYKYGTVTPLPNTGDKTGYYRMYR